MNDHRNGYNDTARGVSSKPTAEDSQVLCNMGKCSWYAVMPNGKTNRLP
jgi:hypothetical protein